MASKLKTTLNTQSGASHDLLSSLNSSLSSQLADIWVTEVEVIDAIGCITPNKSDSSGISTDLLRNAASVVSECVASLFTAITR